MFKLRLDNYINFIQCGLVGIDHPLHLGSNVRKELNATISVGSELPGDNPLRQQLLTKKIALEQLLDQLLT